LRAVAAVAANDVWAVGVYDNHINALTLIEHWDGSTWSIVPSPNPGVGDTELYGVAAVAANDVWAVGYYVNGTSPYLTLIEHWNGSSWSIVPSPSPGSSVSELNAVAAVAANDIWAVGVYDGGASSTLIEHWN